MTKLLIHDPADFGSLMTAQSIPPVDVTEGSHRPTDRPMKRSPFRVAATSIRLWDEARLFVDTFWFGHCQMWRGASRDDPRELIAALAVYSS